MCPIERTASSEKYLCIACLSGYREFDSQWLNQQEAGPRKTIVHSYPFCYRTHKPLIYRAMSCWYVDVTKLKEAMLRANDSITWVPDHLKYGRFGKWLEGARDWAISRNRFWGNPIPVWKCDGSDYIEVIGSIDELEQHSGVRVTDLHKHFVDGSRPSPMEKDHAPSFDVAVGLNQDRCRMPKIIIHSRTRSL